MRKKAEPDELMREFAEVMPAINEFIGASSEEVKTAILSHQSRLDKKAAEIMVAAAQVARDQGDSALASLLRDRRSLLSRAWDIGADAAVEEWRASLASIPNDLDIQISVGLEKVIGGSLTEIGALMVERPEILRVEAEVVFRRSLENARSTDNLAALITLNWILALLRVCRREGFGILEMVCGSAAIVRTPEQVREPDLRSLLDRLISQPVEEKAALLIYRPELMTDESTAMLREMVLTASRSDNPDEAQRDREHLVMIDRARRVGIGRMAYELAVAQETCVFPPEPVDVWEFEQVFEDLVWALSWEECIGLLDANPEFVGQPFEEPYDVNIAAASNAATVDFMHQLKSFVNEFRVNGSAKAIHSVRGRNKVRPAFPGDLQFLVDQAVAASQTFLTTLRPSALSRADSRWEKVRSQLDRPDLTRRARADIAHLSSLACVDHFKATNRLHYLVSAKRLSEAALESTAGPSRATRLADRAEACRLHHEQTGDPQSLKEAIDAGRESTEVADPAGAEIAICLNILGNCLRSRFLALGDPSDLEDAISTHRRCVAATKDRGDQPIHTMNLGGALRLRFEAEGRIADLEDARRVLGRALRLARASLSDSPLTKPILGSLTQNLGNVMLQRYLETDSRSDLRRAVELDRQALGYSRPGRVEYARRQANLAGCLIQAGGEQEIDDAVRLLRSALRRCAAGDQSVLGYRHNLAHALRERYRLSGRKSDLRGAIAASRKALGGARDRSRIRAILLGGLASSLHERCLARPTSRARYAAANAYRSACRQALEVDPAATLALAQSWSQAAYEMGAWAEAVEAAEIGFEALWDLVTAQLSRDHEQIRLAQARGLAARAAAASIRMGDMTRAVAFLERGRSAVLSASLDTREELGLLRREGHGNEADQYLRAASDVKLPASSGLNAPVELGPSVDEARHAALKSLEEAKEAIRRLPGHERFGVAPQDGVLVQAALEAASIWPICYLVVANGGGYALFVWDSARIESLQLPGLDAASALRTVNAYLAAYRRRREHFQQWLEELDSITRWLWDSVMGAVGASARQRGVGRLILVATGPLTFLPLHAAWVYDARFPSGRRYILDDLCVSYAPNARCLVGTEVHTDIASEMSLMAVDEPQPVDAGPLPASTDEVLGVCSAADWRRSHVLTGRAASREAALRLLGSCEVAHFSCHGFARTNEPLSSGLLMAGNQPLTVQDIVDARLPNLRLVVLSACETALVGTKAPDEVVGLPAGFLEAGVMGVVGSLWSVENQATRHLFGRFYFEWLVAGKEPADALRNAQRWLRDGGVRTARDGKADLTFRHPFFWAAFTVTGH